MRNSLELGQAINTFDPAVALQDEYGTFKLVTPAGDELYITCKPGHSIVSLIWGDLANKRPFLCTKISEPVSTENRMTHTQGPPGTRAA